MLRAQTQEQLYNVSCKLEIGEELSGVEGGS